MADQPEEPPNPPADPQLAEIGKQLASRSGFSCIQCHGVGEQPPLAPFEAPAPNLSHISARVRHDYYSRWTRHPNYYLPGTKMPQYGDADGKTAFNDILDGDATRQYEGRFGIICWRGKRLLPPQ